eukprot:2428998-Amphidinium_carterae.1
MQRLVRSKKRAAAWQRVQKSLSGIFEPIKVININQLRLGVKSVISTKSTRLRWSQSIVISFNKAIDVILGPQREPRASTVEKEPPSCIKNKESWILSSISARRVLGHSAEFCFSHPSSHPS